MPTITARQKILAYLKKQSIASAAQIGRGLNMSAATVRHHLSIMLGDGRIALIGEKRKGGKGRPVKLYGLSEKSLGDNFALLSDAVLRELLKELAPAKRDEMISAIAQTFAFQFGENGFDIPMTRRLALIIDKLNELHYQARWEAGAAGPRIFFAHCPYAAIIAKHPELCHMDIAMVSAVTKTSARQISKINPGTMPSCIFMLDASSYLKEAVPVRAQSLI